MLTPSRSIVSGPDSSPRFRNALRLNLSGESAPVCSSHCVYCASTATACKPADGWTTPEEILRQLEDALQQSPAIDQIVIGGNGEPTLHPGFAPIVDGVLASRDQSAPSADVAVVSDGSTLDRIEVRHALSRVDVRLMKLDAGDATTFRAISGGRVPLGRLLAHLRYLGSVQLVSRFVRVASGRFDNTNAAAIDAWLKAVASIRPRTVWVRGWDGPSRLALTPVPRQELEAIASRVWELGIVAVVQ